MLGSHVESTQAGPTHRTCFIHVGSVTPCRACPRPWGQVVSGETLGLPFRVQSPDPGPPEMDREGPESGQPRRGAHEAGLGLDLCHWGPMTGPWKAQGQGQWLGLAPGPPRVEEEEAGSRAGEGRGAWCRGEGAFNYFWFLITIYNTF